MSWEQSRRTRTIAASRSDDNRDEARRSDSGKDARFIATDEHEERGTYALALVVRSNPEENRVGLTNSFRNGPKRGAPLKPDDYPTVQSLVTAWGTVEGYVREFLSRLKDDDLTRDVEFMFPGAEPRSLALGELLQHAANHAVHHRGQVSLLLRLRGLSPDNFDLVIYDAEKRGAPLPQ